MRTIALVVVVLTLAGCAHTASPTGGSATPGALKPGVLKPGQTFTYAPTVKPEDDTDGNLADGNNLLTVSVDSVKQFTGENGAGATGPYLCFGITVTGLNGLGDKPFGYSGQQFQVYNGHHVTVHQIDDDVAIDGDDAINENALQGDGSVTAGRSESSYLCYPGSAASFKGGRFDFLAPASTPTTVLVLASWSLDSL